MNIANLTMSEEDYNSLLVSDVFENITLISVKILPDDLELKEDERYKALKKAYVKSRNELENYRFQKTTNK